MDRRNFHKAVIGAVGGAICSPLALASGSPEIHSAPELLDLVTDASDCQLSPELLDLVKNTTKTIAAAFAHSIYAGISTFQYKNGIVTITEKKSREILFIVKDTFAGVSFFREFQIALADLMIIRLTADLTAELGHERSTKVFEDIQVFRDTSTDTIIITRK